MKYRMLVVFVCALILLCTVFAERQSSAKAALTLQQHKTPIVRLQIIQGRIYFIHNSVTCSHFDRPCFKLIYMTNYGVRPLFLNGQELDMRPHQVLEQTFNAPGIEKYYLFRNSLWPKLIVTVL